ncbi:hypothetical protein MHYP_G00347880 [Metynnis hypsauchen]
MAPKRKADSSDGSASKKRKAITMEVKLDIAKRADKGGNSDKHWLVRINPGASAGADKPGTSYCVKAELHSGLISPTSNMFCGIRGLPETKPEQIFIPVAKARGYITLILKDGQFQSDCKQQLAGEAASVS